MDTVPEVPSADTLIQSPELPSTPSLSDTSIENNIQTPPTTPFEEIDARFARPVIEATVPTAMAIPSLPWDDDLDTEVLPRAPVSTWHMRHGPESREHIDYIRSLYNDNENRYGRNSDDDDEEFYGMRNSTPTRRNTEPFSEIQKRIDDIEEKATRAQGILLQLLYSTKTLQKSVDKLQNTLDSYINININSADPKRTITRPNTPPLSKQALNEDLTILSTPSASIENKDIGMTIAANSIADAMARIA